jgi:amino acid transporter
MGWLIALAVLAAIWAGEWFGLALLVKRAVVDEALPPESRFARGVLRYLTWSPLLATACVWAFALLVRAATDAWPSNGGMDFEQWVWIQGNPPSGAWGLFAFGAKALVLSAVGTVLIAPLLPALTRRQGLGYGLREHACLWGGYALFAASLAAQAFERGLDRIAD